MADTTPQPQLTKWIHLGTIDDIEPNTARYVEAAGRALCVWRLDNDRIEIFDDACPHAGASLSGGSISDDRLVCSLHGWEFRITDGVCTEAPEAQVCKYQSRCVDGHIEAQLPIS